LIMPPTKPIRTPEGVPRYRHIANILRERIIKGQPGYRPGDQLPSEPLLQREFGGVARETIRSAVRVLRDERLVEIVIGVGSFIRPREEWALKG
jgi:DNA-binding GntR family transcriptional regulator